MRDIQSALQQMKESTEWDRANPMNPICKSCDRRDRSENLTFGFCAECQDSMLQAETGCRFGKLSCNHKDCK